MHESKCAQPQSHCTVQPGAVAVGLLLLPKSSACGEDTVQCQCPWVLREHGAGAGTQRMVDTGWNQAWPEEGVFPSSGLTCRSLNKPFPSVLILQGAQSTSHQWFCCFSNALHCLPCLFWDADISQHGSRLQRMGDAAAAVAQLIPCLPCSK